MPAWPGAQFRAGSSRLSTDVLTFLGDCSYLGICFCSPVLASLSCLLLDLGGGWSIRRGLFWRTIEARERKERSMGKGRERRGT